MPETSPLPARLVAFLDKTLAIFAADARLDAVLAGGSLVHGGVDEF
jgi:hypothetical protein